MKKTIKNDGHLKLVAILIVTAILSVGLLTDCGGDNPVGPGGGDGHGGDGGGENQPTKVTLTPVVKDQKGDKVAPVKIYVETTSSAPVSTGQAFQYKESSQAVSFLATSSATSDVDTVSVVPNKDQGINFTLTVNHQVTLTPEVSDQNGDKLSKVKIYAKTLESAPVSTGQAFQYKESSQAVSFLATAKATTDVDTLSVVPDGDRKLSFTLFVDHTVKLTVVPKDKSGKVAKDATIWIDTDSVGVGKLTYQVKESELPVKVCAGGRYFKEKVCESVSSGKPVVLKLARKDVEYRVKTILPGQNGMFNKPTPGPNSVVGPAIDGKQMNGPNYPSGPPFNLFIGRYKLTLPAKADTRHLKASYGKAKFAQDISALKDVSLTIKFKDYPNCSDGLDNDVDRLTDSADFGCADGAVKLSDPTLSLTDVDPSQLDFTYDPNDKYEIVKYRTNSAIVSSVEYIYISKKRKKFSYKYIGLNDSELSPLPYAIRVRYILRAISNSSNLKFKVIIKSGPNFSKVFKSKVVTSKKGGGWQDYFFILPHDFFKGHGAYAKVTIKYLKGKGKLVLEKDDGEWRTSDILTWAYEPELVPDSSPSVARAVSVATTKLGGGFRLKTTNKPYPSKKNGR